MNEPIHNWLSEKMKIAGVLACGIRCPDRKTFTRSQSAQFAPIALENACRCLADTFQVLQSNRFPVERVRWVFEHYFFHGSIRADGICLGVLTLRDDSKLPAADLAAIVAEFQILPT